MHDVVKGCLEVLQQGKIFLESVSDEVYVKVVEPFFIGSSGEHMRHVLDHFVALKSGCEAGIIDYDNRKRGGQVETQRLLALSQLEEIKQWLSTLGDSTLDQKLAIKSEVVLSESLVSEVTSTLARELMFVASHGVHHYSIISLAVQMQDIKLDKNFGIAPATASFLRARDKSCAHSPG